VRRAFGCDEPLVCREATACIGVLALRPTAARHILRSSYPDCIGLVPADFPGILGEC
jgi:hypothetical protein